jgi:hypothetical protein
MGATGMTTVRTVYKIVFHNQSKVYEVYARSVSQGTLYGFVEVEEIVFGERSSVVLDPSEESLKNEFKGVKRTYIPMHSVIRIDEVEKEGTPTIRNREDGDHKVTPFQFPDHGDDKEA